MPSHDITHCAGTSAPICATCWRKNCPVPEGKEVSNGQWTPNQKRRGWCEGYIEGPKEC